MKYLNEKGSSLVVVLASITLITIFATVITAQAFNSSKQVNQTEVSQKATDAAEMGVTEFYQQLKAFYTKPENLSLISTDPCITQITQKVNGIVTAPVPNGYTNRQIDAETSYSIDNISCQFNPMIKKHEFKFTSIGYAKESSTAYSERRLNARFPIHTNNMFPPMPGYFKTCGPSDVGTCSPSSDTQYGNAYFPDGLNITNKSTITASNIYTDKDLQISGYNNVTELIIQNDLFIKGGTILGAQSDITVSGNFYLNGTLDTTNISDLIIHGDAYFYEDILTKPNSFVCIDGTLTITPNSKSEYITLLKNETRLEGKPKTCAQLLEETKSGNGGGGGNGVPGIFASNVVIYDPNSNLLINDNEFDVTYD
ncbi:hypothetical protein [Litchfieldia alkalitelluris]|uniref:hypothetical protein n=1 Tax=Litchfieldia alkalitelluris TaxID=304268 RepID=UPI000996E244|nr:hypothetical protein [Litchfieldia alkalitelluris]